jgi:hypothetical protein
MTSIPFHHTNIMEINRIRGTFVAKQDQIMARKFAFNILLAIVTLMNAGFFIMPAFAQNGKDAPIASSPPGADNIVKLMTDYSRPGEYHQILADLLGTWSFKGRRYPLSPDSSNAKYELFGTHVWTAFADGRYFIVDMTFGDSLHMIQMPVRDGKMKEVVGKGVMIEGYDNVKQKFVQVYITNHIGSGIAFSEGNYDPVGKIITFEYKEEIAPGVQDEIRQLLILDSKDQYTLEYYHKENNEYVKDTEVIGSRVKP